MFERLTPLFTQEGIDHLKTQTVAVIGCGGVGSYAVEALARSGVGTLIIMDDDCIQPSNLNRQIIALHSTLGKKKVDVLKKRILDINPRCTVHAYAMRYGASTRKQLFTHTIDFLFDAVDDIDAKVDLAITAHHYMIPFLTATGAGNRMQANQFTIKPLKNTTIDPLARKLRMRLRHEDAYHQIISIVSLESPIKTQGMVASNGFVPPSAGLLGASYIIKTLLEAKV